MRSLSISTHICIIPAIYILEHDTNYCIMLIYPHACFILDQNIKIK